MIYLIIAIFILAYGIYFLTSKRETSVTFDLYCKLSTMIELCDDYIENLKNVPENDFNHLLEIHKDAWKNEIRPRSLGPSAKFQCEDINNLKITDICISLKDKNVCRTLEEWKNESPDQYTEVWLQYKNILLGSIGSYRQELILEQAQLDLS